MSNNNLEMILEIERLFASLGVGAGVLLILAWQSPKLLQVVLSFVRLLVKDWRSKSKAGKQPRTPQVSNKRTPKAIDATHAPSIEGPDPESLPTLQRKQPEPHSHLEQ